MLNPNLKYEEALHDIGKIETKFVRIFSEFCPIMHNTRQLRGFIKACIENGDIITSYELDYHNDPKIYIKFNRLKQQGVNALSQTRLTTFWQENIEEAHSYRNEAEHTFLTTLPAVLIESFNNAINHGSNFGELGRLSVEILVGERGVLTSIFQPQAFDINTPNKKENLQLLCIPRYIIHYQCYFGLPKAKILQDASLIIYEIPPPYYVDPELHYVRGFGRQICSNSKDFQINTDVHHSKGPCTILLHMWEPENKKP